MLVAPVFSEDGSVSYYLPKGKWSHFLTGEQVDGGTWRNEQYDYFSLPLFVRKNSVIPVGNETGKPDYDYANGVTFHVFDLDNVTEIETIVPDVEGSRKMTMNLGKNEDSLVFQGTGLENWSILLRNVSKINKIENGTWQKEVNGVMVVPENSNEPIQIIL